MTYCSAYVFANPLFLSYFRFEEFPEVTLKLYQPEFPSSPLSNSGKAMK